MSDDDDSGVLCHTHGAQSATLICRHLLSNGMTEALGFFEANAESTQDTNDLRNAWCKDCDRILSEEGEWNDRSEAFARPEIVCEECFEEICKAQLAFDPSLVVTRE
jgi:hypothetical protein